MKSQLTALVAIVVITFAADVILDKMGFSSSEQATGSSVRLSDASN